MNTAFITNGWLPLAAAIIFGVAGTISLKVSHGLKYKKPAFFLAVFYSISFIALTFAMKHIELSVVYAVWSGVGTLLVASIGIIYFNESASFRKLFFLLLIIVGVIGMHLSDGIIKL